MITKDEMKEFVRQYNNWAKNALSGNYDEELKEYSISELFEDDIPFQYDAMEGIYEGIRCSLYEIKPMEDAVNYVKDELNKFMEIFEITDFVVLDENVDDYIQNETEERCTIPSYVVININWEDTIENAKEYEWSNYKLFYETLWYKVV